MLDDFSRRTLAVALDEARPERYWVVSDDATPKGDGVAAILPGLDWVDDVADAHTDLVNTKAARQKLLRTVAHRIETTALRRGNKMLRTFGEAEQLDLDMIGGLNYPVMIEVEVDRRVYSQRVRLGWMTVADLSAFEIVERRRIARDFATRNRTCDAAHVLADALRSEGVRYVHEWVDRHIEDESTGSA